MIIDGIVKDVLGFNYGFWESKDNYYFLDKKNCRKLVKDCFEENILFEDLWMVVLI